MPKMKTKGAAKKRFKVTGNGNVKFKQSFSRHMMMNKPKSMKRKARGMEILNDSDAAIILDNFLPYQRGKKKASRNPSPAERAAMKAEKGE
jgi:large subunit ribosomal protein L35